MVIFQVHQYHCVHHLVYHSCTIPSALAWGQRADRLHCGVEDGGDGADDAPERHQGQGFSQTSGGGQTISETGARQTASGGLPHRASRFRGGGCFAARRLLIAGCSDRPFPPRKVLVAVRMQDPRGAALGPERYGTMLRSALTGSDATSQHARQGQECLW